MSSIYPVNVAEVTEAIKQMLLQDQDLITLGTTISRGEIINEDSNECPWVGIYRTGVTYPSRTLGAGSGYRRQQVAPVIIVQESDPNSGEACEDRLERLIQHIVRVLLTDETLKGKVDMLDSFEVQYRQYGIDEDTNYFMQTASISFIGLVNVSRH